jgi:hypothetical protein
MQDGTAAVAQLVEQRIRNAKVASSIPASGTSDTKAYSDVSLFQFQSGVTPGLHFQRMQAKKNRPRPIFDSLLLEN